MQVKTTRFVRRTAVRFGLVLGLTVGARGRAADDCTVDLAPPTYSSEQIREFRASRTLRPFTNEEIAGFHRLGLPELFRLASENDITIRQLMSDLHACQALYLERAMRKPMPNMATTLSNLDSNFEGIESLVGRPKLKTNHYLRLKSIMTTLYTAGQLASSADLKRTQSTRVNPYGIFDREYIVALFLAVEDGSLEHALEVAAARYPKRMPAAKPPEASRAENLQPIPDEEIEPEVNGEVNEAPTLETNLALIIQKNLPIEADVPYHAVTSAGLMLDVRMDRQLAKQAQGNGGATVRRLLRAIMVGREHAGIKLLHDIGPHIIEVKAVFHGHKRLIGCLKGQNLRLLKMIDIKDQRTTYFKRIARNLCDAT